MTSPCLREWRLLKGEKFWPSWFIAAAANPYIAVVFLFTLFQDSEISCNFECIVSFPNGLLQDARRGCTCSPWWLTCRWNDTTHEPFFSFLSRSSESRQRDFHNDQDSEVHVEIIGTLIIERFPTFSNAATETLCLPTYLVINDLMSVLQRNILHALHYLFWFLY